MIEQDIRRLVYDWTAQYNPGLGLNRTVYTWFMIEHYSIHLVLGLNKTVIT